MVIKRFFRKFSVFDLIMISMMATLGIATKPIIVPLAHMITGPLYIPGGVIAGGFYMMWIVLGVGLIQKKGTATLIAMVQGIMIVSLGFFGTHGIMSLFTYVVPGLAVDILLLLIRHHGCCLGCLFLSGMVANISGTFLVNMIFFKLPWIPLILSLSSAALSGGLGGVLAYWILKHLKKMDLNNIGA